MRSFFSTAALLITIYSFSGCTTSQVECPPDNQPFVVHKNPEKGFPIYVSESRSEINVALDALEQLRLMQLEASTVRELTELQNTLAEISTNFEATTKPSYMDYHQNPCEANVDYFRIMNEINQIKALGNEFNRMAESERTDDEAILKMVNDYRAYSQTEGIQSLSAN